MVNKAEITRIDVYNSIFVLLTYKPILANKPSWCGSDHDITIRPSPHNWNRLYSFPITPFPHLLTPFLVPVLDTQESSDDRKWNFSKHLSGCQRASSSYRHFKKGNSKKKKSPKLRTTSVTISCQIFIPEKDLQFIVTTRNK